MNQAKENSEARPPVKSRTKILRWILAVGVAVVVSAVFFIPMFVSSGTGNKFILAAVNRYLPGKADFGSLSMSWLKGIVVTDFGFRDSAGQTSVRIKRITTKPHYVPIISGVLSFGRTVVDELVVEMMFPEAEKRIGADIEIIELSAINARTNIAADTAMKTIAVSGLRLKSHQIEIDQGSFSLVSKRGKTDLEGQFNYVYDWSAVSDLVGGFLPKGLKLKGTRGGKISFSSEYPSNEMDKFWANLSTNVKVGFEQADYMGLIFEPTEIDVKVEKGLLTIEPFSSRVNNGQLNFAGQADFRSEPVLLKTTVPLQIAKDIQITSEMTERFLMYLNPVFAKAVNVGGIVNLDCERLAISLRGGSKNDIELAGVISVEHLQLEASELFGLILAAANVAPARDITIHPTRFVLQNGLLRYDDMQMDVGGSPINFKGAIGLDKSLNMTVTLPYTTKGETAKLGRETRGGRITLVLKGTLDKPQIDVGKVLEEQLRQELEGQLREKLREGLDKLLK